jgi:hypothetical protein
LIVMPLFGCQQGRRKSSQPTVTSHLELASHSLPVMRSE